MSPILTSNQTNKISRKSFKYNSIIRHLFDHYLLNNKTNKKVV